jgi:hypothetical protein
MKKLLPLMLTLAACAPADPNSPCAGVEPSLGLKILEVVFVFGLVTVGLVTVVWIAVAAYKSIREMLSDMRDNRW